MSRVPSAIPVDSRKLLVERIAQSRHISKSARLHDLLVYLCHRVIDEGIHDIREQEIGHNVFGRTTDYDTAVDNIVRVHASTLRKRLEQYFLSDGLDERQVIEIPKGNYAPVFRERQSTKATGDAPGNVPEEVPETRPGKPWFWIALALVLACSTAYFASRNARPALSPSGHFWAQIFPAGSSTDILLDDGAIDLYQELSGRHIGLSQYFDRSYLRDSASERLSPGAVEALTLRRLTSYADANLIWRLSTAAALTGGRGDVHFARDYTFNSLKGRNVVLLGNSRSNPWIEPFETKLTLRWNFSEAGAPAPVDLKEKMAFDAQEGYASISVTPNIGGSGRVLILSATGGSALNLAGDFLLDDASIQLLLSKLPPKTAFFEALLRIKRRSRTPHDAVIAVCRPLVAG